MVTGNTLPVGKRGVWGALSVAVLIGIAGAQARPVQAEPARGIITTIAGNGEPGNSGDGGPATAAELIFPSGLAYDRAGNLYVSDVASYQQRVRKISPSGVITAFAGSTINGYAGDGGPATAAGFDRPESLAVDAAGNVYIADAYNDRVRRVGADGIVTTFAGTGVDGSTGDGGPAGAAELSRPYDLAFDRLGRLLIVELDGNRVRRVDTDGTISTVAGVGTAGFSGDGGPATAAQLQYPEAVTVAPDQSIIIADSGNQRVRRVDPTTGLITTVAGNGDHGGRLGQGVALQSPMDPTSVVTDNAGNIYITEVDEPTIRRISPNGLITVVAGTNQFTYNGDNQPATTATLGNPTRMVVSPTGDLVVADAKRVRSIRGIASQGYTTVAADGGVFTHGGSVFYGSEGAVPLAEPIVAMAMTPSGHGYWLFARDGGVFTHGDAAFRGSEGGRRLDQPIVAAAATPSGNGYWLFARDGGVFAHGDAAFLGSEGGKRLAQPIVAAAVTPSGRGYWLFASDGGVFTHGDAAFYGSEGSTRLAQPIAAAAATPTGRGYWLFASDGGVFTHGDAGFFGSEGALKLNRPIVAASAAPSGDGYWLFASDGGVFNHGDASFYGSEGASGLAQPIVAGSAS